MNEIVKQYIEKQKTEAKEIEKKERADYLESIGLVDKVYCDNLFYSEEFPFYDSEKEQYYTLVSIEVTDEEFEEIKKCTKEIRPSALKSEKNVIASLLEVIAWVTFIAGFIAGIVLGNVEVVTEGYYRTYTETEFSVAVAAVWWAAAFISGSMFLGFSEIIKQLHKLNRK